MNTVRSKTLLLPRLDQNIVRACFADDSGRAVPVLLADDHHSEGVSGDREIVVSAQMMQLSFEELSRMGSPALRRGRAQELPRTEDVETHIGVKGTHSLCSSLRITGDANSFNVGWPTTRLETASERGRVSLVRAFTGFELVAAPALRRSKLHDRAPKSPRLPANVPLTS